ncbi:conserved hypothetical protein [Cupriavidus taiwanensis]|uniref:Rad50/SbcC-type AAA domain-containing protein n=1 Tax=Cupriavidus taiwanensis TaxID=164546 RepID=A0A375E9Z7_9BURK|nr:AAA family ATPase [Cupriavidus taiwanensis]SOZ68402.1 conserved hypothetical protein [Cupriavidus taiwanensis]SOZ69642.1 conserved hypothetical protein [Cupriavidus taiwanensis]SOZ72857.1 conserved hypothetical protein [Cupriavidus taiwanensis]SPA09716.1 conserved hypothetical protein [Cupriavidus taiwanensis]
MRLLSLKIEPLGQHGWESPLLEFGERTTLIFAKNGSGKTPIIQSIAASLGFPPKFRDEIFGKCAAVTLDAEDGGERFAIRRILGASNRDFHAILTHRGKESEYFNEGKFSVALFEALGLEPPRLLSNKGEAAQPYISTVLPVFYLNQGDGYTAAYKSTNPFIMDQFVEMVRFVFGLNPKHSFDIKKSLIEEKAALEAQTRKIVGAQRILEYQSRGIDDSTANQEVLQRRAKELALQIENLRESVDAKDAASSALTELLRQKDQQIRSRQADLSDLQNRVSGIDSIRTEIEGEVKTLGLNEEARRVFSSFHEICSAQNCGLFIGSTESYGKNLLYLRDQIKDLDRNALRAEIRIEQLEEVLKDLRAERQVLIDNLESPTAAGVDQLITAVQALTKQLVEVEAQLGRIGALAEERSKLFKLEAERLRIQDRIDNLSNSGRADNEFNKLRLQLRSLAAKWMDILDAQNVSRNIDIDLELRFKFNGESLDLFSGSTKIRLILAIHAALFEAYLSEPSRPFRFLILDTPKQQELHTEDLANYLTELEKLCGTKNAQLILSSTEYDHPTGQQDKRWLPMYKGSDHPMYLGNRAAYLGG